MTAEVRILLADDEERILDGWHTIVSAVDGFRVVGLARDGAEAVAQAEACDVVLMDLRMPGMDGLAATRGITERFPEVKTIVVTTFESDSAVWSAMRAGAAGFVLKRSPAARLVDAINVVHAGETLLFPDALRRIALTGDAPRRAPTLTARELEILRLLARGHSNGEIASMLFLGKETVKTHMTNLQRKLDAKDRTHAAVLAYEYGFVHPGIG